MKEELSTGVQKPAGSHVRILERNSQRLDTLR